MKKLIAIAATLSVLVSGSVLLANAEGGNESPALSPSPSPITGTGTHSGGTGGAGEIATANAIAAAAAAAETTAAEAVAQIPQALLLAQDTPTKEADYSVVDDVDYTLVSPQTGYVDGWDIAGL